MRRPLPPSPKPLTSIYVEFRYGENFVSYRYLFEWKSLDCKKYTTESKLSVAHITPIGLYSSSSSSIPVALTWSIGHP
jgi:hypothetical protein